MREEINVMAAHIRSKTGDSGKERKGLCESNFETEINNAGNSPAVYGERTAQKS